MAERLTTEQLEHIERISLTPARSTIIPTMQLRQLVREHRELRDQVEVDSRETVERIAAWVEGHTLCMDTEDALGLAECIREGSWRGGK